MTTDLRMLTYVAGFTALLWLPYILARTLKYGPARTLTYKADAEPLPGWAERAKRAHYNAIENLAPFAALVLVANATGATNHATAISSITYFWARVAHFILYVAGVPFARTLTFAIGWAAMACIFWQILWPTH